MSVGIRGHASGSNLGKWNSWYQSITKGDMGAFRYGDTVTYRMASIFLGDVREVEDWGCGAGGFKRFCLPRYVGVDGSNTPFADRIVDLCTYKSQADGILLRHVIEHNYDWEKLLENAVSSFESKLCLVLFTPFTPETREIAHNLRHGVDVPDIAFARVDIERKFDGLKWELIENLPTNTGYGIEHVYFVWKPEYCRTDAGQPASRRAVYTAIFGGYDSLYEAPKAALARGIDFICFTDDETLTAPGWQIRLTSPPYERPRMSAKHFKALPHIVLPEYDETLWIDGGFRVSDESFAESAFKFLGDNSIALFRHPDRDCIYQEAEVSRTMKKYSDEDVVGQVSYYRMNGYPEHGGLFAGGMIARRRDDRDIRHFNEMWMIENLRFTYQDQLSLAFLLRKMNIEPAVFPYNQWLGPWGTWTDHASLG